MKWPYVFAGSSLIGDLGLDLTADHVGLRRWFLGVVLAMLGTRPLFFGHRIWVTEDSAGQRVYSDKS